MATATTTRTSARTGKQSEFWFGRVLIGRVLPITVAVLLTFNMSGWSLYHLAVWLGETAAQGDLLYMVLMALLAVCVFGFWLWVLNTCWQGAGGKMWKFIIIPVIAALILAIPVVTNVVDPYGSTFVTIVEVALGLSLGFMFCLTLISRHTSGITTGAVTVQEDDTHPSHEHSN